jgi:hypothetical protein
MDTQNLIPAADFCMNHNVEVSFIHVLQQNGLVEFTTIEEMEYIQPEQLQQLEKIIRLHYELDINLEGIETVIHLLERIDSMHREINTLRNRLRFYEGVE